MDKKAKIVFFLFIFGVLVLSLFVYKKYFLDRDYTIFAEIPCDPITESCFVSVCDPEEEECTGSVEEDTMYSKKIEKHAGLIPLCDPNTEGCVVDQCDAESTNCGVILCNVNEDECSLPEDFLVSEELLENTDEEMSEDAEVPPMEQFEIEGE